MKATNPETGEVLELQGGQWVSLGKPQKQGDGQPPPRLSTGAVNAALVSAGDQMVNMGRNVRDMWAGLRGDKEAQTDIAFERQEADDIRARLHGEAPVAAGIGAMLPSLATLPLGMGGASGAGMLARQIAGGTGGRLATNLGTNAALGGLSSTSGNIGQDALMGAGLAGATSMASNMVGRVAAGRAAAMESRAASRAQQALGQAAGSELDDAQREILAGAQRAGLTVTPGQLLNDPTMRKIEAAASSNPVLSPYWDQMKQGNARQINTLAARAMGVDADNVGAAVLAQAEHKIGEEFAEVGRRVGLVDTAPLKKKLSELAMEEQTALLPRVELESILNRFERGAGARAGAAGGDDLITGQALMRERSRVAGQMRDAYARSDSTLGALYGDVVDAMDDAVKQSASRMAGDPKAGRAVAQAYDSARDKWTVLRAMQRGGSTIDGQVLTGKTAGILGKSDATRFLGRADDVGETLRRTGTGRLGEDATGDFYDGVRFAASQLGKDIVGDSGTATRSSWGQLFEGGPLQAAGRIGGMAARRAVLGPLAERYMNASPEAAQAFSAAMNQSSLAGWRAGQRSGQALGRAGQAAGAATPDISGMNESGMLPPGY